MSAALVAVEQTINQVWVCDCNKQPADFHACESDVLGVLAFVCRRCGLKLHVLRETYAALKAMADGRA